MISWSTHLGQKTQISDIDLLTLRTARRGKDPEIPLTQIFSPRTLILPIGDFNA
jgi:hypothetical protein